MNRYSGKIERLPNNGRIREDASFLLYLRARPSAPAVKANESILEPAAWTRRTSESRPSLITTVQTCTRRGKRARHSTLTRFPLRSQ